MAFTQAQKDFICNIVANATYKNFDSYVAYAGTGDENFDLYIYVFNKDTLSTSGYLNFQSSETTLIKCNTNENDKQRLEIKENVTMILNLDSRNDVATNTYYYAYNPVANLEYYEINPTFEIPKSEVVIQNDTNVTKALNDYLPKEFFVAGDILLAIILCILILKNLYKRRG